MIILKLGWAYSRSQWALSGVGVAVTLVVLLSAWFRHRQGPILTAFLLMGAAVVTCIYADDVLLVTALAVGVTSADYLATPFVGFLLPVRWQPWIDAAAINVTLLLGSISSMLVLAEILLDPEPRAQLAERQTGFGRIPSRSLDRERGSGRDAAASQKRRPDPFRAHPDISRSGRSFRT